MIRAGISRLRRAAMGRDVSPYPAGGRRVDANWDSKSRGLHNVRCALHDARKFKRGD